MYLKIEKKMKNICKKYLDGLTAVSEAWMDAQLQTHEPKHSGLKGLCA